MKLKVICQDCGKTAEIDTNKINDWEFSDYADEDDKSEEPVEWTCWYCPKCAVKEGE